MKVDILIELLNYYKHSTFSHVKKHIRKPFDICLFAHLVFKS